MFRCPKCGRSASNERKCSSCGSLMEFQPETLRWRVHENEPSIWRYRELLPKAERIVSLGEGLTDVRKVDGTLIKDETRNPTGSYVDRGASVIASCSPLMGYIELDFSEDVTVSLASYLLSAGNSVSVRVDPENIDVDELLYLSQLDVKISFGSGRESDPYEDPLMIEGFKTIAYEIYEFRGDIRGIVIPSESGVLAYGVVKGFSELERMGLLDTPKVYLAQHGPKRGELIDLLVSQGASFIEADPRETVESLISLAKSGIYVKPISAMAYAIASKMGRNVIALLTGTGLRKLRDLRSTESLTELQRKVLSVMKGEEGMTAYQIWRRTEGATLQGVYKALRKLSRMGLVSSRKVLHKKRVKRVYCIARSSTRFYIDAA